MDIELKKIEGTEYCFRLWNKRVGGRHWIIDASCLDEDGEIEVDLKEFNIEIDSVKNKLTLKFKEV